MILHGDTEKRFWREVYLAVVGLPKENGVTAMVFADKAIERYRDRVNVSHEPIQRSSSYDVRDQAGTYDP